MRRVVLMYDWGTIVTVSEVEAQGAGQHQDFGRRIAAWDRTRFINDVFVNPSVGPTAAWLLLALLTLVAAITVRYAPNAAARSGGVDCSSALASCISPELGVRTIFFVAVLTFAAGIAPIVARRVFEVAALNATTWSARSPRWLHGVLSVLMLLMRLVWFLPAFCFSLVDYMLARPLALLAGAALQPALFRYTVLITWLSGFVALAYYGSAPVGLLSTAFAVTLILAVSRRWAWVERDREAFFITRMSEYEEQRVGFRDDLRDEALFALVFLFVLLPLGLRQLSVFYPDAFSGSTDDTSAWFGYFGAELAKSVPFVDWSEVLHVENGSPIAPQTTMAGVVVFGIRATLDLLLIAAVVQAVQLAARLAEQNAAFAAGKIDILEPFGERRRFRALADQIAQTPAAQIAAHPALVSFPTYSAHRLGQVIRGGDGPPAQAEGDPKARFAALALARRQLPAPLARSFVERANPASLSEDMRDLAASVAVGGVIDELVDIPSGQYWMGARDGEGGDDELPRHLVMVPAFAIGAYPVTFDAYDVFCAATGKKGPSDNGRGRGRYPVINVSWYDICGRGGYLAWLNDVLGLTGQPGAYRLPSEAEWEYACRAQPDPNAAPTFYCFGDDEEELRQYAWFDGPMQGTTFAVGRKRPNALGLYDMHGNVEEWCADSWDSNYSGAPTDGSAFVDPLDDSDRKVHRGGCFLSEAERVRSAYRGYAEGTHFHAYRGFRLARTITG